MPALKHNIESHPTRWLFVFWGEPFFCQKNLDVCCFCCNFAHVDQQTAGGILREKAFINACFYTLNLCNFQPYTRTRSAIGIQRVCNINATPSEKVWQDRAYGYEFLRCLFNCGEGHVKASECEMGGGTDFHASSCFSVTML